MGRLPERPFIDPGQMVLPGCGPIVGELYRNKATGNIAAIIGIEQRKAGWVTIRAMGTRQTVRIDNFLRHYEQAPPQPRRQQ